MQAQETLIIWSYEVMYLAKILHIDNTTMYHIDRADDDCNGTYADETRVWNFPTFVVDEMGGDQAQLQRLLDTLAPTKFADPATVASNAA